MYGTHRNHRFWLPLPESREWNLEDESVIKKQLKYEFYDTLLSMVIGWAINSAMIILAASTFFKQNIAVDELDQAQQLLVPLVGNNAGVIFAAALLLAGISSTITSGIAGASIFAGFYGEAYNHTDLHSKLGVLLSFVPALAIIFLIGDPFKGLILSQMLLSVQLPITVFTQVYLTSSKKVMGVYANSRSTTIILLLLGTMVTVLNIGVDAVGEGGAGGGHGHAGLLAQGQRPLGGTGHGVKGDEVAALGMAPPGDAPGGQVALQLLLHGPELGPQNGGVAAHQGQGGLLSWRSVQVPVEMRRHYLRQRFTVCISIMQRQRTGKQRSWNVTTPESAA